MTINTAGVSWRDELSNEDVARRCGVEELNDVVRRGRLRWFGHVKRAGEGGAMGRAMGVRVEGRRSQGRPRKTWSGCVEGDLVRLGVGEEEALDMAVCRRLIGRPTP